MRKLHLTGRYIIWKHWRTPIERFLFPLSKMKSTWRIKEEILFFKDTVFSFMVLAMKLTALKNVKKVLFHAWLSVWLWWETQYNICWSLWCWEGLRAGGEGDDRGWDGWMASHWLDGRESEWTPGVGDGQGGLACCDSWGRKESDTTERLIWSDLRSAGLSIDQSSLGAFGSGI